MKIRNYKVRLVHMVYLLLTFGVLNACLRLTSSGMSSLFRILSPLIFLIIVFSRRYLKAVMLMLFLFSYSTVVSLIFYKNIAWDMWVFLLYLFILYILMDYLKIKEKCFEKNFLAYLNMVTTVAIILCWMQFLFRIPYPYLSLPNYPAINVFMSNENEIAAPLACMCIIYIYKVLFEKEKKYVLLIINICLIMYINDAKLSMIGLTIGGILLITFLINNNPRKIAVRKYFTITVLIFVCFLVGLIVINPEITFRDYNISINELVFDHIKDIISLKPTYGSGGSFVDRTNAIIFGLMELKNSYFMGIGWGNTIVMLGRAEYDLMTANSMHNIVVQVLVEFGVVAIVFYFLIFKTLYRGLKDDKREMSNVLKLVFFISFIFISSQSSIGILSNYYLWMIVLFVYMVKPDKTIVKGE